MFATEFPIIQAPMAGVQDSTLTIAISEAGGLGSLPCAMLSTDKLSAELARITAATDKPYNVNFFCHTPLAQDPRREQLWQEQLAPYYEAFGLVAAEPSGAPVRAPFSQELADVLAEFSPPVVSFHFGLPAPELLQQVKSMGCTVLSSATHVAEALWLQAQGADAVIAQGLEAGGHRGMFLNDDINTQLGTLALVPQLVEALEVPVVAAGGLASNTGVKAALALGAAAVQLGTVFLLCPEAHTSAVHRAALKSDTAGITALTNVFSGKPARSIVNRLMREQGPILAEPPPFPTAGNALAPLRARAEADGSGDFSPLWAGQNTTGCSEIPAADLLRQLGKSLA